MWGGKKNEFIYKGREIHKIENLGKGMKNNLNVNLKGGKFNLDLKL